MTRNDGGADSAANKTKWSWGEKPPQLYLLCALAVLSAAVGLFAPERLPVPLIVIGGLALLTNPVSGLGPIKRQRYVYCLIALLAWAGLSLMWSGAGKQAIDTILELAGFSAFGILLITYARELRAKDKRLLGRWLVPSVWAFGALFLIDRGTGNWLTGLFSTPQPTVTGTALLLLSWPAAGMLLHSERPVQALLLLTGAGLVQAGADAQTIVLAWIAGGVCAAFAAILPRATAVLLGAGFSAAILAAPFLAGLPGILQRLVPGADAMADIIRSYPFLGTGFGTFEVEIHHAPPNIPGSTILQIWLELGIFGAVILSVLVGMLAAAGCKGPPAARATRTGLLAAAFALACVSHGAWQSWWVAALFITGAFAAALPDRVREK